MLVYSHLGGGAHVHLSLVLTPAQYALISTTTFGQMPHPVPLEIPSKTINGISTPVRNTYTEAVHILCELLVVKYTLIQKVISDVE